MKSLKWKILNSLWIIPTFIISIPALSGVSFIYAGFRVKKKLWVGVGICLSAISIIAIYFIPNDETISSIWFFSWVLGIVYVFIVLREYLIRLEAMEKTHTTFKDKIFQEYAIKEKEKYNENTNKDANIIEEISKSQDVYSKKDNNILDKDLVDLNIDPESVISELPGITVDLARKIVEIRYSGYKFSSIEDLAEKINLKPHIQEKLRPLTKFSMTQIADEQINKNGNKLKGRKVDF